MKNGSEGAPFKVVRARRPPGARDLFGWTVLERERIIDTIRHVYELYGFEPLQTSAFEHLDILRSSNAGQEVLDSMYHVISPKEKDRFGLRFDLTVPLARVLCTTPDLQLPYRRYQVASVWRCDKPSEGQFREFTQFDLDAVGVAAEIGDTEIIAAMCDTLRALNVGPFEVRLSSRAILKLLLDFAGIPHEQGSRVFAAIDKLEKIGSEKVRGELTGGYTDTSGVRIAGLGLTAAQADRIELFLQMTAPRRADVIDQLRDLFANVAAAPAEIDALERISRHLHALDYGDDIVRIDLSVARGLDYYTGTVFEAAILDARHLGSVFSGGRYDDLIARFGRERIPASGASLGVDRLVKVLQHVGRLQPQKATARVFVANLDPRLMSEYLALTWDLRRAKIPTELYLGTETELKMQLKYADHRRVPLALLYRREEHRGGEVTIRHMPGGREKAWKTAESAEAGQITIARELVVETVAKLVKDIDSRPSR
jgi:histidyl-tRNA synthetase